MAVTDEMTQALRFAPSLRLDGDLDVRVPDPIAQDMLLALREALSNAARHARATRVDVTVHAAAALVLTVRDNGVGFSVTSRRSGLANLAQRAQAHGGKLEFGTADGGGTVLEWTVPLPP